MIRAFANAHGLLRAIDGPLELKDELVWIDAVNPTGEEENELERLLGIDVPTWEEMEEIEISSRLYKEDGAVFMTATLPAQTDDAVPLLAPVSFVLAGNRLITVRYHEPRAFQTFPERAARVAMGCDTGEGVLVALLEATVDRLADILERAGRDLDRISREVFQREDKGQTRSRDFQAALQSIGRMGDMTSKMRDSLLTLGRLVGFFRNETMHSDSGQENSQRIETLSNDVRSIADHAGFLSQKITFLLDAILGMINIEQNAIIKIFSVAAVVFMPSTLIASIYGMNFLHMPELDWPWGYPLALALMLLASILPYVFFKLRGWL